MNWKAQPSWVLPFTVVMAVAIVAVAAAIIYVLTRRDES